MLARNASDPRGLHDQRPVTARPSKTAIVFRGSLRFRDDPAHHERILTHYEARERRSSRKSPGSGIRPVQLAFAGAIRVAMQAAGIRSYAALGRRCRLSQAFISRIARCRSGASATTVTRLSTVLQSRPEDLFAPAARLTDEQRQNVDWQRYPQPQPSQRPTPDFEPTRNRSFTDRRERPRPGQWNKLDAQRLHLMSDEDLFARIAAVMVRNGVPA